MPRTWTDTQKRERAAQVREYYQHHPHPRRGQKHSVEAKERMQKPKRRPPVLGHCEYCHRPLYSPESVRRGYGAICAGLH